MLSYEGCPESLNLAFIVMPCIESVDFRCVTLNDGLILTELNAPYVQSISLSNIEGEIAPFKVELPHLRSFFCEHSYLGDSAGLSKSLAHCPRLEIFDSYKFRMLDEQIWYLPSIREIRLHRAECFRKLIILYAPKLE